MAIDETWDIYHQIKMKDSIHPYIHSPQRSMQSKETCSFWGWGCSWLKVFQDFWNAQLRRRFCTNCYMPKRICHSVHTFSCPGYAHVVYSAHTAQCKHCTVYTLPSAHSGHPVHFEQGPVHSILWVGILATSWYWPRHWRSRPMKYQCKWIGKIYTKSK